MGRRQVCVLLCSSRLHYAAMINIRDDYLCTMPAIGVESGGGDTVLAPSPSHGIFKDKKRFFLQYFTPPRSRIPLVGPDSLIVSLNPKSLIGFK